MFEIFSLVLFAAIKYGNASVCMSSVQGQENDLQQAKLCRDALAQLLKMVQSISNMRYVMSDLFLGNNRVVIRTLYTLLIEINVAEGILCQIV